MAREQDRVRAEWQAVAGGWRRWEPLFQSFTWPLALRMTSVAQIGDGQRVLDVGCGIGDPTLQVAVLVGPHGRVLGIDLIEDMLATGRERAAALGLGHVEFRAGDVSTIELAPHAFDAVLGRWSLIYVADVAAVLARLREALVPGGRIAVAAWAPAEANPWITIPMKALARILPVPAADPAAPGLFHLSPDGALVGALTTAGFRDVRQERVQLSQFAHDATEFWAMLTDMAGPLAPMIAGLDTDDRERVLREVTEGIGRFRTGDVFRIPAQAQLAWGRILS
jgi:ubiquinone/menaquinone biosynthesis C-methylase UbiE